VKKSHPFRLAPTGQGVSDALPVETRLLDRPSPTKPNRTIGRPSGVSLRYLSGLESKSHSTARVQRVHRDEIEHRASKLRDRVRCYAIRRGGNGPSKRRAECGGTGDLCL
jgi:hypothetical protein